MVKLISTKKYKYYVVIHKDKRSVVNSWEECKKELNIFKGAIFKGFYSLTEAESFVKDDLISKSNKKSNNSLIKKEKNDSNNFIIYTDGSCLKNPNGAGGYASYILNENNNNRIISVSGGEFSTTNNRMEIRALIESLKALSNITELLSINIYSDSQYLIKAFNNKWIQSWKKNGWKTSSGSSVKNIDLWKQLDDLINSKNRIIKLIWCKGHVGNDFNELCDKLAKKRANDYLLSKNNNLSTPTIKYYTHTEFEKYKHDIIEIEKKDNKINKSLKKLNKNIYSNNNVIVSFIDNEIELSDLLLFYYKDKDTEEKPPVCVLDIDIRRKEDNSLFAKYMKVFFGYTYPTSSRSIFIKKFLSNPEIRQDFFEEGIEWTEIINLENKNGVNLNCQKYIERLNKMENISFKNMMKLKVGGKDFFSTKTSKELVLGLSNKDINIIKKEKFETKDFETALRWLHRGLKADLCVRKVKTDIEIRKNAHYVKKSI